LEEDVVGRFDEHIEAAKDSQSRKDTEETAWREAESRAAVELQRLVEDFLVEARDRGIRPNSWYETGERRSWWTGKLVSRPCPCWAIGAYMIYPETREVCLSFVVEMGGVGWKPVQGSEIEMALRNLPEPMGRVLAGL
jgi:hypothetical protein